MKRGSEEDDQAKRAKTQGAYAQYPPADASAQQYAQYPAAVAAPAQQAYYDPAQYAAQYAAGEQAYAYADPSQYAAGTVAADGSQLAGVEPVVGTVEHQLQYLKQLADKATSPTEMPDALSDEPPSKVVHFRHMTEEITQGDIMTACIPFGQVDNVLMMRTKNQCLVMFNTMKNAIEFMNYYVSNFTQPTVRGRKLYVKYSRHQQITAANSAVSTVLLVTLMPSFDPDTSGLPINTDMVWQIFSPYGTVEKLVIINKTKLQTLVKYETQAMCAQAYEYLNDQEVYVGAAGQNGIKLVIQYSQLNDLTVRGSSTTSADYTQQKQMGIAQMAQIQMQQQLMAQHPQMMQQLPPPPQNSGPLLPMPTAKGGDGPPAGPPSVPPTGPPGPPPPHPGSHPRGPPPFGYPGHGPPMGPPPGWRGPPPDWGRGPPAGYRGFGRGPPRHPYPGGPPPPYGRGPPPGPPPPGYGNPYGPPPGHHHHHGHRGPPQHNQPPAPGSGSHQAVANGMPNRGRRSKESSGGDAGGALLPTPST